MTIDEATLDRLEALARAATPGPWRTTTYNGGFRFDGPKRVHAGTDPEFGEPRAIPAKEEDTDFIAAADPDVVLALCRLARKALK